MLVVDDNPEVRDAYLGFFAQLTDFTVSGEARNGAEAVTVYATLLPDLVLMDLQMPGMSGIEATRQICQQWPGACVVAITTFGTSHYVVAALRAGAAGYLVKDVGGPALLIALRQALAGDMPLSSAVRLELVSAVVDDSPTVSSVADIGLTPREVELLGWLAQGMTNHQIGTQMYVSEGAIKQYLTQAGRKIGVRSRTGILIRAVQLGLVDPHAFPVVRD